MKTGPMTKEEFLGLIGLAGFTVTGEIEMKADPDGGMRNVRMYCYRVGPTGIEQRKIGYYEDTLGNFGSKVVGGIYPDLVFGEIGKDPAFREAFDVAPDVVAEQTAAAVADKAAIDAIEKRAEVLKAVIESKVSDVRIIKAIVNESGVAVEKRFTVLDGAVLPCDVSVVASPIKV